MDTPLVLSFFLLLFLRQAEPDLTTAVNSWNNKTLASINAQPSIAFIHARHDKEFYMEEYKNINGSHLQNATENKLRLDFLNIIYKKYPLILNKNFYIIEVRKEGEMFTYLNYLLYKEKSNNWKLIELTYQYKWIFTKYSTLNEGLIPAIKSISICQDSGTNSYYFTLSQFEGIGVATYSNLYPVFTVCDNKFINYLNKVHYHH